MIRCWLLVVLALAVASPAAAQRQFLALNQNVNLAWDASPQQEPPDEAYKVRVLAQSSPTGVTITEIVTPSAATTYTVPAGSLPIAQDVWFSVRSIRTVNIPGESGDSNVIGPFMRGTPTPSTPSNLRGVVVSPTPE